MKATYHWPRCAGHWSYVSQNPGSFIIPIAVANIAPWPIKPNYDAAAF
jgi:hypothetical protein